MLIDSFSQREWTPQISNTTQHLKAIIWTDTSDGAAIGQLVAVGDSGTIITSPDGITWTQQVSGTTGNIYSIVWNGSQYVVVGSSSIFGFIRTSPDGITWTNSPGTGNVSTLRSITWTRPSPSSGTNQFMVVGINGTMLTSNDAISWTTRTSGTDDNLYSILWTGTTFVIVGKNRIFTTPNGSPLSVRSTDMTRTLYSSAWSSTMNLYVAVGHDTSPFGSSIMSSTNGTNWGSRTSGSTAALYSVVSSDSQFVAVGSNGTILISVDGTNWSPRSSGTSNQLRSIVWAGNQFVTVGNNGTILTSAENLTPIKQIQNKGQGFFSLDLIANLLIATVPSLNPKSISTVSLYSTKGIQVFSNLDFIGSKISLPISNLPNGWYTLEVRGNDPLVRKTFLLTR